MHKSDAQQKNDISILQAQLNALYLKEQVREQMSGQLKYTFIVVVTGYGMVLTLWSKLYDQIPVLVAGWSAVFIGVSVLSFLTHEFYKTWAEGNTTQIQKKIVSLSPREALHEATKQLETNSNSETYIFWWKVHFAVALGFGVVAFLMIVAGFIYQNGLGFFDPDWWRSVLNTVN